MWQPLSIAHGDGGGIQPKGIDRQSLLSAQEEDLAKNVSLSLHDSFCLNRESRVKSLPNQAKRLQEQREWMRSYEQLKAWEEIVISSDDEEALCAILPDWHSATFRRDRKRQLKALVTKKCCEGG